MDHDLVYFLGAAGDLHCLKVADGHQVWHHDLAEEFGRSPALVARRPYWGAACSPLVDGDRVFIATGGIDGAIAAFEKRTGDLIWKALDASPRYSSPIVVTIDSTRQVVFFTGRGLVGVTPEDGTVLWRYPWTTNDNCNVATPIVSGNYVFISSGYDRGCVLLEISRNGGDWTAAAVYQHRSMRNHFATSVLYEDHLYGFDNTSLTCMEFRTGKVRWRQSGFGKGSLLIAGEYLIVLGENRKLAIAAAIPEDYREVARCDIPFGPRVGPTFSNRCWVLPALARRRLYVREQQHVLCLDLRKP